MDYMSTVQSIVRKYFDNAIVIDDKLEYGYPPIEKLKDSDINFESLDDLIDTEEKVAPVVDEGNYDKSNLAYNQFVKDGFVTFQYKFIPQHEDLQIKNLENVISNAKLMILDWNIEDAKPESPITAGGIAVKLIQRFVEMQKGLKCVVIYTQEDCNDVLNILKESYEIVNKEKLFFQEKNSEDGCSFFG
ncbi:MAG TPA: response regulator receiver domain, partial [Patescibacteria group bacterium]|nr:response regulator receiver domain [Patescibacteria group bacterium]